MRSCKIPPKSSLTNRNGTTATQYDLFTLTESAAVFATDFLKRSEVDHELLQGISMGETDGRTDGRIAVSLDAPYRRAGA